MFSILQLNKFQGEYNRESKIYSFILIILLSACFTLLIIRQINFHSDPQYYDTTAYLGEANFIDHHGGVMNFLNLCISGVYKQANQHPLYILLLTPFASLDISFFIIAKFISAILGLILLIVLFFIGRKMYGDMLASIAVVGLLLNSVFLTWTSMVACESLLMLLSLLCIYFIMKGFKNNRYWIYAGIFAGLSYLTKGTAILLLPGFVISSIITYKLLIFKNKFFWMFFILFTLTAFPLLIRNILVYHNPFYNVNNNLITMGHDKINESVYLTFDLKDGVADWKFEKSEIEKEDQARDKNFEHESSLSLATLPGKIIKEGKVFLDTLNINFFGYFGGISKILSLLLFLLFIVGLKIEKNKGGKLYFLITFAIFLLSLLIMPINRYFLPLIPFMWIYIALGTYTILKAIKSRYKLILIPYIPPSLILLLVGYGGLMIMKKEIKNPVDSVVINEGRMDLLNWLRSNLKNDDLYTMGPNFNWQLEKGTWVLPPGIAFGDFSKFQFFIKEHQVSYIIIDTQILDDFHNPRNAFNGKIKVNNKESITKYFVNDPSNGITERQKVIEWDLIYKDQKKPTEFLIYKLNNPSYSRQDL